MENPRSALDALVESPQQHGNVVVYPLTVVRYALLELVGSPFLNAKKDFGIVDLLPSLYIVSTPTRGLSGYNSHNVEKLVADAYEWSDNLAEGEWLSIIQALSEKIALLAEVQPEIAQKEGHRSSGKKAPTAG